MLLYLVPCVVVLYVLWYFGLILPGQNKSSHWGPRWLALLASNALCGFGNWYLSFTHDTEEKISEGKLFKPGKQYVMVWHPHGAFAISALYFLSNWWAKDYPMPKLYVCIADLLFRVPGLAEYLLLCNARSGNSKTFNALLEKGNSVAIQPGGIAEQVNTDDQQETVFFPAKLGFIRIALKHGVPLLPIYAFGENQLYTTTKTVRSINMWLYKTFSVGSLFQWGRGGLLVTPALPNPAVLPIPSSPLHIRWGEPVDVGPADDNPSDEKVLKVFDDYCTALKKLFDAHKDTCLPKEVAAKGLTIVRREAKGKKKD